MREIKFRVFKTFGLPRMKMDYNPVIYKGMYCDMDGSLICDTYESDTAILMQYTGLKDANGKEIYEGDIVKYVAGKNYENTGVVIWADEKNSFNLKTYPFMCGFVIHNEKESKTDKFEWDETNYMQVVGNIYENPELLESNGQVK